ncbi:fimbrial protein [Paralysiella testudinis]|uniref:Fimbrial protein n=1 Tax=Paralysiella testudinis TaxID=2809020 RepID=A0A892ZIH2_9NEIS|nr:fimbrial protein [Paralysiella testudinis]
MDMVLGPLLTLVVASDAKKKTLKFDMAVIIACQIAAYLYGMHSIAVSRPVYVAFDVLRFEVVQADSVVRDESKAILPQFERNPWFKFHWAAVRPFQDAKEQNNRTFYELQTGISPTMQAHLYQSIEQAWPAMNARKHHLDELKKYNSPEVVQQILHQYPQTDSYLPLKAPVQDMAVLLDSRQRKIIKIVDLRPF